jgi:cadmium resistance protein CadD (predicted permease)
MELYITLVVAITAFTATNLDDIFILMSFFAMNDNKAVVVIGQYIGFMLLLSICFLGYFSKVIIPAAYIPLFGILPIIIGLKYLWNYKRKVHQDNLLMRGFGPSSDGLDGNHVKKIFHISGVTLSNGGDNLGVYIPLFLSMNVIQVGITSFIFLIMTGIWCIMGYLIVSNKFLGKIGMYIHILFPLILILIGIGILLE